MFDKVGIKMKKRAEYLDIAKGIGILLVVWAHAKGPFSSYIYQFHMPLFFLISGYLFNEKNTVKQFIIKKIRTLYIPFVFWNIFFTILSAGMKFQLYSRKQFLSAITEIIFTIGRNGMFLGATWFLASLFLVSIFYKIMDTYLPKTKEKSIFLLMICAVISYIGFTITFPYMISRTLVLAVFFAIGRLVKTYKEELLIYENRALPLFFACIFIVIARHNSANMGANQYKYRLLFVIGALAASYTVIKISEFIETHSKYLKSLLCFWGCKSISIVIWQFVVFRIVIALQLYLKNISLGHILDYYPCYKTDHGWWVIYILVGMYVSVFCGEIIDFVKKHIVKLVNGNK